jgi:hypothetical protein
MNVDADFIIVGLFMRKGMSFSEIQFIQLGKVIEHLKYQLFFEIVWLAWA